MKNIIAGTLLAASSLGLGAMAGAVPAHADNPSSLPYCETATDFRNCKITYTVQDGYVLTYWFGANGQSHLLKSETTLPGAH